ncbi:olfactory receptor 5V1-like [Discoglossus pictus]
MHYWYEINHGLGAHDKCTRLSSLGTESQCALSVVILCTSADIDMHASLENRTVVHEFFLVGFSDFPNIRFILFVVFLLIYMMTLTGNLVILVLIHNDHHLHTPMYFFLGHLACMDAFSSSITVPQMIVDLLSKIKSISHMACVTQMFFFLMIASAEAFLLAVMSYDRYVAICQPLHYTSIMSWKVCILMTSAVWALGFTNSFIHSIGLTIGFFALCVTFVPYIHICRLIFRIPAKEGKHKAFSTCTSHLTVVSIFYGTLLFTYFRPAPTNHDIGERIDDDSFVLRQTKLVTVPAPQPTLPPTAPEQD